MSQRRTAPSRLSEGSGLGRVVLSLQETARRLCNRKFRRQFLACSIATITMGLVGTVNGWIKISLAHLTTGSGDVPLMITEDESSWVVSLTVLGSMIGSLLAAQLADRIGRKYCLLVCSTMFTIGWLIICFASSAPMLYLAGVTLGIGVGIAHTINPMFVSEVADIKYRGSIGVLIAANVNSGILLTYALSVWLTYKLQLALLVIISLISILTTLYFPETPYFLVAKGQKEQACKSIVYYKCIEDPDKVKMELRTLRDQVRHELHQQVRYELLQQSTSDLHSESGRDLPPQSRSDLPSQSRSDLPSQSTYVIHSEVVSEEHQQPTGELRPQSLRELHSQSRSHLRKQSSVDLQESTDIPETYMELSKYTCLDKLRAILQRSNRNALFIMLGLIMAQQLSGNFSVTEYLEQDIDRKWATFSPQDAMIFVQVVRYVSGYIAMLIVTHCGRRKLLIVSTMGSCLSLIIFAGCLFLDQHNFDHPTFTIVSIHFLSGYQLLFQIGLGLLPNVLLCDLFPTELKGIVGAIVVIFNGIVGFTATKLNQVIIENVEWHAIFTIFATLCSLAFLMVFIWVPETKGKTYNEIEALLTGENLNSSNEEVSSDEMDSREI
ncbi:facilitated trehalose transporter Tret1-like [Bombus bifarius]|uniref:Facilitated trehalose transporter Tret1-like n=1 Tax=Bombus bifarius TaxID=103933 RepID=A0A6P8MKH5_9HYME|nr:facilitated trehalose transporter Tret1-like [Bombus bifarius]